MRSLEILFARRDMEEVRGRAVDDAPGLNRAHEFTY